MKKHISNYSKLLIVGSCMLVILACTLTRLGDTNPNSGSVTLAVPAKTEIPTLLPTVTTIPVTETPERLNIPLLATREIREEGDLPVQYILEITYPFLENGGEKGEVFNDSVQSEMDTQIEAFMQSLEELGGESLPGPAGLYISYTITTSAHNLISVKFDVSVYTGGAHPYPYSLAYNFDLSAGQPLALENLFEPGSDYLQKISDYCIAELQTREAVFPDFEQYIQPDPENFPTWNIQDNGLLITFDVYLVAPYAAGPQMVEVPYETMKGIIGAQSPLSAYLD